MRTLQAFQLITDKNSLSTTPILPRLRIWAHPDRLARRNQHPPARSPLSLDLAACPAPPPSHPHIPIHLHITAAHRHSPTRHPGFQLVLHSHHSNLQLVRHHPLPLQQAVFPLVVHHAWKVGYSCPSLGSQIDPMSPRGKNMQRSQLFFVKQIIDSFMNFQ